jgi:hypothetical protein
VDDFLNACAAYAGGKPPETLRQLTKVFDSRACTDVSAVEAAAAALSTLPPHGAAYLAVMLGALVEDHGGAERSAPAIVDLLLSWLPQLPHASGPEAEPAPPTPQQAELLVALKMLAHSVVAHLARCPELREKLSQHLGLLDRLEALESYTVGAAWIREMLLRSSGSLIILHVQSRRAFQLQYRNVATCFHLFSLLQTALGESVPGGRTPSPLVASAARGRSSEKVQDEAWWHYGDPHSNVADLRASIWGEALVREIPVVDGQPVMILWPAILASRSWDSSFFGPQLDAVAPDVTVESELPAEASAAWFETLGIRRARRKWWPW